MMGVLEYYCAGADKNNLPSSSIDNLLLNALDHGANPKKTKAAKEMCRRANPKSIILDSSGYQLLKADEKGKTITFDEKQIMKNTTKHLNITPQQVMEVAAMHYPDIVIGLDFPIRKLKGEARQQIEFQNKKEFNVPWSFESFAWKNCLVPDAWYFQPLQFYFLDHLNDFLDRIRGIQFDGVSMPLRTLKPSELALSLVNLYQRGINRIHLLGSSSFPVIVICAYAAWNFFDWVSFDSTTWRFAADKAGFLNPLDLSRTDLRPSVSLHSGAVNFCPCPFCHGRSFQSIQALTPRNDKVRLLRQHNWWAIKSVVAALNACGGSIFQLEKEIRHRSLNHRKVNELISILSLVDVFKDGDINTLKMLLESDFKIRNGKSKHLAYA